MGQRKALEALLITEKLYKQGRITLQERDRIGDLFLKRLVKSLIKITAHMF